MVAMEISDNNVSLEDIFSGNASAFAAVHSAAMISLVADPVRICPETCPETLLFDVGRISELQCEFNRIVDGAMVLTVASHMIISGNPSAAKGKVLNNLAGYIIDNCFDPANLCRELDSASVLVDPVARGQLLKALDQGITNKSDAVRQLMWVFVPLLRFTFIAV